MTVINDKLTIMVTPKLEVSYKDAVLCLALVNVFLKDNKEYRLEYDAIEHEVRLTDVRREAEDITLGQS